MSKWIGSGLKLLWILALAVGLTLAEAVFSQDAVAYGAEVKNSSTADSDWSVDLFELVNQIPIVGDRTESQQFVHYALSELSSNDRSVDRKARYLSVHGTETIDGRFNTVFISEVTEDWKKTGDAWQVTQKIYSINLDGEVFQIYHRTLHINAEGNVTDSPLPHGSLESETEVFRQGLAAWLEVSKRGP